MSKLQLELTQEEKRQEALQHHQSQIEKQLKELESTIEKKIQSGPEDDLGERIESLEETIEQLSKQLESERKEKASLEQKLEELRGDQSSFKQKFEQLEQEKENLAKSLEAANTEKDEISKTLRNKQEELETYVNSKQTDNAESGSSDKVIMLEKQVAELTRTLKAAEEEKNTTIADYTEALVKKEEELEDAKATVEDYKELTKNKEVIIRDLEKRLGEKEKQLSDQKSSGEAAQSSEVSELQNEINELKKSIKESEQQVSADFRNAFVKKMKKLNDTTKNYSFEGVFNKKLQSQDKVPISAFFETMEAVLDEFVVALKKANAENKS